MQDLATQAANKQFLRSIADNNNQIPDGIDNFAFARALLANLGSPDGELRDDLSYMILASGIIDQEKLTSEQMGELLTTVLDSNHLFYHIGETNTDSVFMRSFSNLIVAAILYTDAKAPELSEHVVQQTRETLLRYVREERDWRGYVEGKGWAHAMAHLADALDECAQNQSMTTRDRQDVMLAIRDLAQLPVPLYHEEDMRLATVAHHIILVKQVDEAFLSEWLESCYVRRDSDILAWMSATNVKNFLRSLYFLLLWDNMSPLIVDQISNILKRQDDVYIQTSSR